MSVFLPHGDNGTHLNELIGAADAMNHAIPTQQELTCSLTRLASCGILHISDNGFKIADAYLPEIAKANQGKGGMFSTPEKGRKWLLRVQAQADKTVQVIITDEEYLSACKLYRRRLRQLRSR